ncbi:MAG: alpha/beta fold hydrolase [Planctomycetota bacterium]
MAIYLARSTNIAPELNRLEETTVQTQDWNLTGADGQPILGRTYTPTTPASAHLIICHGFKGYQDYGFLPVLARAAANHSLLAHTFNFSHSGMTRTTDTFERPDLFERDSWSKQTHDVRTVFDALPELQPDHADLPVVLFGHSRGGIAVALATRNIIENSPRKTHLTGLITAAAPADGASPIKGETGQQLRTQGHASTESARTGQTLLIGKQWLDEIEPNPEAFDPVRAATDSQLPHLAIHGSADPTVPATDCQAYADANPRCTALVLQNASHTFNCPNPFPTTPPADNPPPQTTALIQAVLQFTDGFI